MLRKDGWNQRLDYERYAAVMAIIIMRTNPYSTLPFLCFCAHLNMFRNVSLSFPWILVKMVTCDSHDELKSSQKRRSTTSHEPKSSSTIHYALRGAISEAVLHTLSSGEPANQPRTTMSRRQELGRKVNRPNLLLAFEVDRCTFVSLTAIVPRLLPP